MTPLLATAPLHAGAAALCLVWAALVWRAGPGRFTWLPALYCLVTAAWAAAVALDPARPVVGLAAALDALRSLAAVAVLAALARRVGGGPAGVLAGRFALAGALLALLAMAGQAPLPGLPEQVPALVAHLARVGLALVLVLIAENIARNSTEATAWHVNLPCIAIAGLAGFDLVVHADAALNEAFSRSLLDARAVLAALAPALLVLAALRDRRWNRPPTVSRQVVFHSATLVIAGAFLLGVGVMGEVLRRLDPGWGVTAQAGLLAGALMALAVALSSRSFRSRIRRRVVDHFFTARYDYRAEWMRCVATLAAPDRELPPLSRAIRAVADAVDVPGGVLLRRTPEAGALLHWAESWNLPERAPPAPPAREALLGGGEALRRLGGAEGGAEGEALAAVYGPLWLAVPLLHPRDGLTGAVLLAPPRAPFPLDAEVEALLLTLGREVALFLAEREAAERLADARGLAEYAKRFAFVAHDVKTVSNQLSLMLANAEAHMDDPEFQRDLLTTMRASASRINTLIARLRQDEEAAARPAHAAAATTGGASDLVERLRALGRGRARPVEVVQEGAPPPPAAIPPESLEAAVTHLLNNAAEASPPGAPVRVVVRRAEGGLEVDIIDRGPGMSAEFIRDELFRPLATSKPGGSGIGAWQARELVMRAGGSVAVLSRPGEGTTMRLRLPAGEPG